MSNKETSDKDVVNIENMMIEEAFNELIDNFEVVAYLTPFGRKGIKQNVKKLQKRIQELEEENATLRKANNITKDITKDIAKEVKIEEITQVMNKSFEEFMSNYISIQKAKDVLQKNRNELFTITYVSENQYEPYKKQIDRINKIEQELLEGEK